MKMKCSKCGGIFEGPADACPHCGVKFKKPEAPKAEEAKPSTPAPEKPAEEKKVEAPAEAPAKVEEPTPKEGKKAKKEEPDTGSYWDGHLIQLIGIGIATFFLSLITLGIMFPWGICKYEAWHCKHSVYDGYRLTFDGKTGQLIGNWIKWVLLSIVTLTIYAWFVPMKMEGWIAKHTHLVKEEK